MNNQSRSASKYSILTAVTVVVAILLALLFNILIGLLPTHIRKPNISGSDAFRVSPAAEQFLKDVNEDVTLYFICEGGSVGLENEIYLFLSDLARINSKISLQVIDPNTDTDFIADFGGVWPENMSLLIKSEKRYQFVLNSELYYYYTSQADLKMTPSEYETYLQNFMNLVAQDPSYEEVYYSFVEDTVPMFDGCSMVCNTIQYVLLEHVPTVYFLIDGASTPGTAFINDLYLTGYNALPLSSLNSVPADCELLVIHCPSKDLSGAAAAVLEAYLEKGGKLILSTNLQYGKLPNLNGVLQNYGLSFPTSMSEVVCEGDRTYMYSDGTNYYPNHIIAHRTDHPAGKDITDRFSLPNCHEIIITEASGVTQTPWLYTSKSAYLANAEDGKQVGDTGEFVLGAIAEKENTRIVWLAGTDFSSSVNGEELLFSAYNWSVDCHNQMLKMDGAKMPSTNLSASSGQLLFWSVVLVILLPLSFLIIGIAVKSSRKKR